MWWGQFPIPKWVWWAMHPLLLLETLWEDYPVVRLIVWSVLVGAAMPPLCWAIAKIIVWLNV